MPALKYRITPEHLQKLREADRRRRQRERAWSVPTLLKEALDAQGQLSQSAWREVEVLVRSTYRDALRARKAKAADAPSTREIRDLAQAASIAYDRAYPQQEQQGNSLRVPARLLQSVSAAILARTPQPVVVNAVPLTDKPLDVQSCASEPVDSAHAAP